MKNVSVNHVVLNKLMNYVRDRGYRDRDFYRVIHSNDFTLRWCCGYEVDSLYINFKEFEDSNECLRSMDEVQISRFLPNTYLDGEFYKALKMARVMFQNDFELYQNVINSYKDIE